MLLCTVVAARHNRRRGAVRDRGVRVVRSEQNPPTEPVDLARCRHRIAGVHTRQVAAVVADQPAGRHEQPGRRHRIGGADTDRLPALLPISPPMLAKPPVLTVLFGFGCVESGWRSPCCRRQGRRPGKREGGSGSADVARRGGCADRAFVVSGEAAGGTRSAVHRGRCGRILDAAEIPSDQAAVGHQQALGAGDPTQAAACARIVDGAAGIVGADQAAADAVRAVERDRRVRRNLPDCCP